MTTSNDTEEQHEDVCNDCRVIQDYVHELSHDPERRLEAMEAMGCHPTAIEVEVSMLDMIAFGAEDYDKGYMQGLADAKNAGNEDSSK